MGERNMARPSGVLRVTFFLLFVIVQNKGQFSGFFGGDGNRQQARENGERTALIFLHGLAVRGTTACEWLLGPGLGLSPSMNEVRCPSGPFVTSWFNFWLMPGASVLSPIAGESKSDLEEALVTIEGVIEELMDEGIPSENIVLSGASQGGVLTIYTALHSKHKLGGFMPIVTWFPLLKVEPPSELPTPVNVNTPILHLNGLSDPIVPLIPAGSRSKAAMEEFFSNYEMKNRIGTHTTTMGPQNILTVRRWLRKNTNINFSTLKNLVGNIPGLGSLGFGK